MTKVINDKHEFKIISGQSKYINQRKRTLTSNGYTPIIDKFYQANGIDFRCNVRVELNAFIDNAIEELSEDNNKVEAVVRSAIKISKINVSWKPNKYIKLDSIIAIMNRVNVDTQTPPVNVE